MHKILKLHLGIFLLWANPVLADYVVSDQILPPFIDVSQLPEYDMTRIHFIYQIPVDALQVEELENEIHKYLSYTGKIKSINNINELHIYDNVRNVKKIVESLNKKLFLD
ncbi:MAG: hypothetical protein H6622_04705 [Halobacteriovoraceae bacterium]|nr:hypothetical protein [Halobacteriovoraceae bacterium]